MSSVKASARVKAPAIARLEPSPNSDTQCGVTDEADSTARPRRHPHPADGVEVQVVGDDDAVQQLRHAPTGTGVHRGQQSLVLIQVAVVEMRYPGARNMNAAIGRPRAGWTATDLPG